MKKSLILTSLLAIVATGAAKAETDVTFGGNYALSTDTGGVQSGVVTTAPADATYCPAPHVTLQDAAPA